MRGVLEAYRSAHAACDLEGVMRLFAPDAVLEDPAGSTPISGPDAIRAFFEVTHRRNGRLDLEPLGRPTVGGDRAVLHVRARGEGADRAHGTDVIYVIRVDATLRIRSFRAFFELG